MMNDHFLLPKKAVGGICVSICAVGVSLSSLLSIFCIIHTLTNTLIYSYTSLYTLSPRSLSLSHSNIERERRIAALLRFFSIPTLSLSLDLSIDSILDIGTYFLL